MKKTATYLGENVKRLRKSLGLSQRDLAFDAGVAKNIIEKIESGNSNVTLNTIERIAECLNVDTWELLLPN